MGSEFEPCTSGLQPPLKTAELLDLRESISAGNSISDKLHDDQESEEMAIEFQRSKNLPDDSSLDSVCFSCSQYFSPGYRPEEASSESVLSEEIVDDLSYIRWEPMRCPVTTCGRLIGKSSFAMHYFEQECSDVPPVELKLGKQVTFEVDYKELPHGSNYCLGFFLFDGQSTNCQVAANRLNFPYRQKHLRNHLPVLLLACRTHLSAMIGNKDKAKQFYRSDKPNSDILVLWLATVATKRPLRAVLRASSHSGVIVNEMSGLKVRNVHDTQAVEEFLSGEMSYLNVCAGLLRQMSADSPNGSVLVSVTIIGD